MHPLCQAEVRKLQAQQTCNKSASDRLRTPTCKSITRLYVMLEQLSLVGSADIAVLKGAK